MKILHIIETLGLGGAERALVDLVPYLQKKGLDINVATLFDNNDLEKELLRQNINVYNLNLSYKWNIYEGITKLNTLIKENKYDIIHAHLFFAYFYTGLTKSFFPNIKRIVTFHNLPFNENNYDSLIKKIRKKIDCFILNKSFDSYIAVSNAVKEHYEEHCALRNINTIYNPLKIKDIMSYKGDKKLKESLGLANEDFIILTVGRFVEQKGYKEILRIANFFEKKYKNIKFIFVGEGPLKEFLKKTMSKNIYILETMEHKEVIKLYDIADVFLLPTYEEAFGLVVAEAMIKKVPVISTNVGGLRELVIDKKTGFLVEVKNIEKIKKLIEKIYRKEIDTKYITENAFNHIQQFDIEKIVDEILQVYKRII